MDIEDLEKAYAQASQEIDPAWDVTIADGLSDETWEDFLTLDTPERC